MEQLQRRVEGQLSFARGEPFAGLGSVGGLEGRLPARRAAGSGFVPAGFLSPRSSVNGDSGTASAPRIGENTVSSNVTKQIKDVPLFHGAKAEFPKFRRDLITLAKQHGLFRVFTEMLRYLLPMRRNQSQRSRRWVLPKMKFENTF